MLIYFATWILLFSSKTVAKKFIFAPTNRISIADNWGDSTYPCKGDNVRFDDSEPVAAFMDHSLESEMITLPQDGVIVFADSGFEIPGESHWQCEKRELPIDAFFSPDNKFAPFHNPESWVIDDESYLHMNQVPSAHDNVHVPELSSVQIYFDRPVSVNSFHWYSRENMTTDDFNHLMRTLEGQFQIQISPRFARESDIGGIQRNIADDIIKVNHKNLNLGEEMPQGWVNQNSQNETLKQICSYIRCEEKNQDLECLESFTPFGHCCPVCGAKLEVAAHNFHLEEARERVLKTLSKLQMVDNNYYSMERISNDDLVPIYEITIVRKENDSSSFDQEIYKMAALEVRKDLALSTANENGRSILKVDIFHSKTDRSIRTISKLIGYTVYGAVLIILIGGYVYKTNKAKLSRFAPIVTWRRRLRDEESSTDGNYDDDDDDDDDGGDEKKKKKEKRGSEMKEQEEVHLIMSEEECQATATPSKASSKSPPSKSCFINPLSSINEEASSEPEDDLAPEASPQSIRLIEL